VQLAATAVASIYAAVLLRPIIGLRRLIAALAPCLAASAVGALACAAARFSFTNLDRYSTLAVGVLAYALGWLLTLRIAFVPWLVETLRLAPFRRRLLTMLGLPAE
jgi:hypothetical protein